MLRSEVLKLQQDSLIDLYEIDLSPTGTNVQYFFVSDKFTAGTSVNFKGVLYVAMPIDVTGFESTNKAPFPKPTMVISNILGTISSIMLLYADLVGAKVTRRRTYVKYLDFMPEGGTNQEFPQEIYYIERPIEESEQSVTFELVNGLEMEGLSLPRRYITRRCSWRYRSPECGYTGSRYYTNQDVETSFLQDDKCSHTVKGCKLRFGDNSELPYGGFPVADIY